MRPSRRTTSGSRQRSPAPRSWKPSATEEIRKLTIDLAGVKKEREIIDTHLATVQQQLANARKLLDEAIAENRRLADEFARREARNRSAPAVLPAEDRWRSARSRHSTLLLAKANLLPPKWRCLYQAIRVQCRRTLAFNARGAIPRRSDRQTDS